MRNSCYRIAGFAIAASIIGYVAFATNTVSAQSATTKLPPDVQRLTTAEEQIAFNVLDRIEYDAAKGRLILMGHFDPTYPAVAIPYYQHLATLLQYPAPEFSLEWVAESERRVAELFRRMDSDAEMKKIVSEWGRWLDERGKITPAGRYFLPIFGVKPQFDETHVCKKIEALRKQGGKAANRLADLMEVELSGPGACKYNWDAMDRYQIIAKILLAADDFRGHQLIDAMGMLARSTPGQSRQDAIESIYFATNTIELAYRLRDQMVARRITREQAYTQLNREICRALDDTFSLASMPVSRVFEASLQRDRNPENALTLCFGEMDRQMVGVLGKAFEKLKPRGEVHVPLELVNPSLRGTVMAEPKYYNVDGRTLLGKVMFEADFLAKRLINMPELTGRIKGYQTEFAFQRSHPGAGKLSGNTVTYHLWISVDRVNARQSQDGTVLAFDEVAMRFNIREKGKDGRDLPPRPDGYEALLTGLYNSLSEEFPALHEVREVAKLAYAAQWLKVRAPSFALPAALRQTWDVPQTVQGTMYIAWSPIPPAAGGAAVAISAMGGISFRLPGVPDVGPSGPVKVDPDLIRSSIPLRTRQSADEIESALPLSARLIESPLFSPYTPPASNRSAIFDLNVAYCLTLEAAGFQPNGTAGPAPSPNSFNADQLLDSFFDGKRSYATADCRGVIAKLEAAQQAKVIQATQVVGQAIRAQVTRHTEQEKIVRSSFEQTREEYLAESKALQQNSVLQRRLDPQKDYNLVQSLDSDRLLLERRRSIQVVESLTPKLEAADIGLQKIRRELEELRAVSAQLQAGQQPVETNTTLRVVNNTPDYITVSVDGVYGCNTSTGSTCTIPVSSGSHQLRAVRHDTGNVCGPRSIDIPAAGYTWSPWPSGPC